MPCRDCGNRKEWSPSKHGCSNLEHIDYYNKALERTRQARHDKTRSIFELPKSYFNRNETVMNFVPNICPDCGKRNRGHSPKKWHCSNLMHNIAYNHTMLKNKLWKTKRAFS
jgi:hypothetical protein